MDWQEGTCDKPTQIDYFNLKLPLLVLDMVINVVFVSKYLVFFIFPENYFRFLLFSEILKNRQKCHN